MIKTRNNNILTDKTEKWFKWFSRIVLINNRVIKPIFNHY